DEGQDELAQSAVVGAEEAPVEAQEAHQGDAGDGGDSLGRGPRAGPPRLDPKAHGCLIPGGLGHAPEHLAQASGLLGGGHGPGGPPKMVGSAAPRPPARAAPTGQWVSNPTARARPTVRATRSTR